MTNRDELAISEHELGAMTTELDMLHKETFPAVQKTFGDLRANLSHLRSTTGRDTGRRTFLLGVGGAALVGGVAACSSSGGTSAPPATAGGNASAMQSPSSSSADKYAGDLKVVGLAAALENLAIAAYAGALKMAGQHKLGKVPPAFATFTITAMAQHKDHAAGWNSVVSKNNVTPIRTAALTFAKDEVPIA